MYSPNAEKILQLIHPDDVVLDIGGWARPFNRADYVLDVEPYETRGYLKRTPQGGDRERFTKQSWIQRDICDKKPFPFADKAVDFVICSHTLEDIRDPLWVCSEMIRVAKRGYIEVPSRIAESCRGIEPGIVGWSHHRWLIDIAGERIQFLMKYHTIHGHWRLSLPAIHFKSLPEERQVQWLFWDDSFEASEKIIHGGDNIVAELEGFVASNRRYPRWRTTTDSQLRTAKRIVTGAARRTARGVRLLSPLEHGPAK